MRYAEHLGDGAYVHLDDSGGVMLTANHHDPLQATDKVYLDGRAVRELQKWLENTERNIAHISALRKAITEIDTKTSLTKLDLENRNASVEELEALERSAKGQQ